MAMEDVLVVVGTAVLAIMMFSVSLLLKKVTETDSDSDSESDEDYYTGQSDTVVEE